MVTSLCWSKDRQSGQIDRPSSLPSSPLCRREMEDYILPVWIYLAVLTVFVAGAMKKVLACHVSTMPTLVAWLGATVLVERLWTFCLPAILLVAAVLAVAGYLYCRRSDSPAIMLSAQGKAVFITGKSFAHRTGVCVNRRR